MFQICSLVNPRQDLVFYISKIIQVFDYQISGFQCLWFGFSGFAERGSRYLLTVKIMWEQIPTAVSYAMFRRACAAVVGA